MYSFNLKFGPVQYSYIGSKPHCISMASTFSPFQFLQRNFLIAKHLICKPVAVLCYFVGDPEGRLCQALDRGDGT